MPWGLVLWDRGMFHLQTVSIKIGNGDTCVFFIILLLSPFGKVTIMHDCSWLNDLFNYRRARLFKTHWIIVFTEFFVSTHVFYPFTQQRKCLFLIKVSTWRQMRLTASINHGLTLKAIYCQYIILIRHLCMCRERVRTRDSFCPWFVSFLFRKFSDSDGVLLSLVLIIFLTLKGYSTPKWKFCH